MTSGSDGLGLLWFYVITGLVFVTVLAFATARDFAAHDARISAIEDQLKPKCHNETQETSQTFCYNITVSHTIRHFSCNGVQQEFDKSYFPIGSDGTDWLTHYSSSFEAIQEDEDHIRFYSPGCGIVGIVEPTNNPIQVQECRVYNSEIRTVEVCE